MAVICSLLISSCKVGRDYVRPETSLTDTFRGTVADDGMALDSVNIADLPWSAFFTDSMLTMLFDSAIANNFDMQAALKNIEIANQSVRASRVAFLPPNRAELAGRSEDPTSEPQYLMRIT